MKDEDEEEEEEEEEEEKEEQDEKEEGKNQGKEKFMGGGQNGLEQEINEKLRIFNQSC